MFKLITQLVHYRHLSIIYSGSIIRINFKFFVIIQPIRSFIDEIVHFARYCSLENLNSIAVFHLTFYYDFTDGHSDEFAAIKIEPYLANFKFELVI